MKIKKNNPFKIDIITLFPEMFEGPFAHSIMKRAQDKSLLDINIHNLRDYSTDKHNTVDDRPYGGGKGMVLMVEPIYKAINDLKSEKRNSKSKINNKLQKSKQKQKTKTILLSPQGKVFTQKKARELSKLEHLILIAGHYEGFDERVRKHLVDEEISIGEYVLTGGELPAMIITDTIVRLIPGVLSPEATQNESFSKENSLDYPQYTRPENFKNWKVPSTLLSGNHKEIERWREKNTRKIK